MTTIDADWHNQLASEFNAPYMQQLYAFLKSRHDAGAVIYPPEQECFNALNLTPFYQTKVVIIGQDPYHGPNQAHGLSFSVKKGVKTPPSLVNIYKELQSDLGIMPANHGCLEEWAQQGVLLLNSVLTVEQASANAHQGKGWEFFTDRIIERLNAEHEGLVFMLWGAYAQKKGKAIDRNKHLVLESVHPSPLSAHRGFLGCRHFSTANQYLLSRGKTAINWQLSP